MSKRFAAATDEGAAATDEGPAAPRRRRSRSASPDADAAAAAAASAPPQALPQAGGALQPLPSAAGGAASSPSSSPAPGRAGSLAQRLQRPEHLEPGLRSQPWHDPGSIPWCRILEQNVEVIRSELLGTMDDASVWPMVRGQVGLTRGVGEWRELVMLGPGSEVGRRRCPRTAALLVAVPAARHLAESVGACGNAIFAKLTPGTRLHPHCGPTNTRLTCHLGVIVPEDCGMRVGRETRTWRQGECLVFDDSWEHEVWNLGTATRVVLLVNFWHPDLPPERWDEIAEELHDGFLDV